uniref:Odorant receptor n=1 Tax=Eucryptorrhynchus scrobiculatus TaxID=1552824 RepID=A0A8F4N143_EUCSC|nr:odorant receptor 40 [Eucryptorrhynchus scrobiculatus]
MMTASEIRTKVDKMDLYEVIKIPKLILQIFGQWPSENKDMLLNFRGTFSYAWVATFTFTVFMEIYHVFHNLAAVLRLVTYMSPVVSYMAKILALKLREDDFVVLYKFLDDPALTSVPDDLQHYVKEPFRTARNIGLGYLLSCALTICLMSLLPLFTERYLPVTFTVFELGRFYHFMYFFQCFGLMCAGISNAQVDFTAMSLSCLVSGQIGVLNENIRCFREKALQHENLTEELFLARCVYHHSKIITLIALIERVLTKIVLIQYITSVVVICNIGFQLVIVEPFSFPFVLMLTFFTAKMLQLGLYCWFGNEIILSSLAVRDACYESDWINSDVRVGKMLLIIMERTKRPLYLTAGKFSVLSLASFTSVINSAYSFFALMQTMYVKTEDN